MTAAYIQDVFPAARTPGWTTEVLWLSWVIVALLVVSGIALLPSMAQGAEERARRKGQ